MQYYPDLSGQTFGWLFVMNYEGTDAKGNVLYRCQCRCGKIVVKSGSALRHGIVQSCNCRRRHIWNTRRQNAGVKQQPKQWTAFGDLPHFQELTPIPEQSDCAYFSGHFDGEGFIGFQTNGQKTPHITVKVSSIFKPVLTEYASCFGGFIGPGKHQHRMVWTWQLVRQHLILRFIESILPFAKEKKAQLELAKEFISLRLEQPINMVSKEFRDLAPLFESKMKDLRKFQYGNSN